MSAKYWTQNSIVHRCTKHKEIDIHFIREQVLRKELLMEYYPTEYQLVDLLIKSLSRHMFFRVKKQTYGV